VPRQYHLRPAVGQRDDRQTARIRPIRPIQETSCPHPPPHDTAAEQDPIEGVVKNMHIVLPVAGAVLIFMLAFIAVFMA
jgi:hypothetical protein